jgi:Flp pilus assembly protein TadG
MIDPVQSPKRSSLSAKIRKKLRESSGGVALEFAFAFSFFGTPIMLGVSQVALMVYDSIELSNCAHAGAMYGMMSSTFAADSTGIQNAAQSDASDFGSNVSVTPSSYYACSNALDGAQYSTESAASAVCPANASNHYLQFVKVVANMTITPPVHCPGLPSTFTLSRTSVMEVQE